MKKVGNSKKFEKLEKRANELGALLCQKEEERNSMTREIDKDINKLQEKWYNARKRTMQQYFDEGGDF